LARDTPTAAIGGMASFYRAFYDHDQTKATTHLNEPQHPLRVPDPRPD